MFLNKINGKMQNTSSLGIIIEEEKKRGTEASKTQESIYEECKWLFFTVINMH